MTGDLEGRVAIVTGAASGIGRGIALTLAGRGAKVMATDINASAGHKLAAESRGTIAFAEHDVTDEAAWERVYAEAAARFGAPNVLVNNAGMILMKDLVETSLEEWRRQNAVNLDSCFLGTRIAIREMSRTGGGRIVNISSVNGIAGVYTAPGYSASKGGVTAFTKSAALYCAQKGYDITVNSVHPGYIGTNMIDGLANQLADPEKARKSFARAHPLGRLGEPQDIAEGVAYLCGPGGRWVTGSELVIDGGFLAQ